MQSDTHFNEKQYESDDSDSSVDIDLEYLKFSKKTLEHQEKIGLYLYLINTLFSVEF